MELSFGELVDRLIVTNLKIWHLVELVENLGANDFEVAEAARKMQTLNGERTELKNELNRQLGSSHEEIKMALSPPSMESR